MKVNKRIGWNKRLGRKNFQKCNKRLGWNKRIGRKTMKISVCIL